MANPSKQLLQNHLPESSAIPSVFSESLSQNEAFVLYVASSQGFGHSNEENNGFIFFIYKWLVLQDTFDLGYSGNVVLKSNAHRRNTFPHYLSVWSSSVPGYSGRTVGVEQRDAA